MPQSESLQSHDFSLGDIVEVNFYGPNPKDSLFVGKVLGIKQLYHTLSRTYFIEYFVYLPTREQHSQIYHEEIQKIVRSIKSGNSKGQLSTEIDSYLKSKKVGLFAGSNLKLISKNPKHQHKQYDLFMEGFL